VLLDALEPEMTGHWSLTTGHLNPGAAGAGDMSQEVEEHLVPIEPL